MISSAFFLILFGFTFILWLYFISLSWRRLIRVIAKISWLFIILVFQYVFEPLLINFFLEKVFLFHNLHSLVYIMQLRLLHFKHDFCFTSKLIWGKKISVLIFDLWGSKEIYILAFHWKLVICKVWNLVKTFQVAKFRKGVFIWKHRI